MKGPFIAAKTGFQLFVYLTPRADRDEIGGLRERAGKCCLCARVRALPEKGKANEALLKLLAKSTGIAKSRFSLVAGQQSRFKTILLQGEDNELSLVLDDLIKRDG